MSKQRVADHEEAFTPPELVQAILDLVRTAPGRQDRVNQAIFAFRRYEDSSLCYTSVESHERLGHFGPYDTVVARES